MPINGSDIVCTIDLDLQQIAEEAIVQQLKACPELEWGCAVLMEVHTGAVRAIANKHKEARTGAIVEDDNYALRYRKDPGSTFKLISFMVMLEKGLDLGQRVATGDGSVRIGDKLYEDEGSKGGGMSAAQVFINSSNAGTVQLIRQTYPQRRDWHDFVERIDAMGIRGITKFDIDPRQDIAPVIRMASDDYLALYAMSIGVSLEMTPLQTLTIYNAIAGGGRMVHPFFVHEVRRDGRTTYSRRQGLLLNKALCSPQTLERLQRLLCAVVDSGTARRARSPMLAIAGKTGTAHIAEGSGGYTNKKLASFAGYFPAQRPRYSGIVAFRTYETTGKTYGGMYAAPVFRAIAEKTYASSSFWKGVAAQEALLLQSSASSADYQRGGGVPYTKSGSMALLQKALSALSIPAAANAAAQWVTAAALDSVVLMQPRAAVSGLMPDVVGMGVMDAVYLLEEQGLRVHLRGRGTIVSQTPKAGAPYDRGDMVSLELTMNN
jgi:cell division protein FtsI (penicillin-binding protein 3)